MTKGIFLTALAAALLTSAPLATAARAESIKLTHIARHSHNIFDKGAAEIVAFHGPTGMAFVVNGAVPTVDMIALDGADGNRKLTPKSRLQLSASEAPTSVALHDDLVAIAVHDPKAAGRPGKVLFFSVAGQRLGEVTASFLPDMVTFTPDGRFVLTANEGEPDDGIDPEGSVTIIDLSGGVAAARARTADFQGFDAAELKARGVRLFPGKTAAQDLEPEYIAIAPDSRTAYVTLQENNAIARVDIAAARVTAIHPLGVKDHAKPGQGLDPNDKDGITIAPYPLFGMYMPDGIAAYEADGRVYLVTANEGDARDEDAKLGEARIDAKALTTKQAEKLAKIRISTIDGDSDGDGDIDRPHSYGARSFSIWTDDGQLVFDSGDQIERITADILGQNFNHDNEEANSGDKRSDNKGPEPEGVAIGRINGKSYAFIGLERVGGVMIYDISNPRKPMFIDYQNDRNFIGSLNYKLPGDLAKAGDIGPEGITFVPAAASPTGLPLLLVANETSGSLSAYNIETVK